MITRLLLNLTYGVLADIEAEDLARESFARGLHAMIGGSLILSSCEPVTTAPGLMSLLSCMSVWSINSVDRYI